MSACGDVLKSLRDDQNFRTRPAFLTHYTLLVALKVGETLRNLEEGRKIFTMEHLLELENAKVFTSDSVWHTRFIEAMEVDRAERFGKTPEKVTTRWEDNPDDTGHPPLMPSIESMDLGRVPHVETVEQRAEIDALNALDEPVVNTEEEAVITKAEPLPDPVEVLTKRIEVLEARFEKMKGIVGSHDKTLTDAVKAVNSNAALLGATVDNGIDWLTVFISVVCTIGVGIALLVGVPIIYNLFRSIIPGLR